MPPELVITNPPYTEMTLAHSFNYNPNEDLLIEWVPAESPSGNDAYVQIVLSVVVYNWNLVSGELTINQGIIVCYVVDDGQYIISSDILQQLPVLEEHGGILVDLIIYRIFGKEIQVPLTRVRYGKLQVLSINNFRMISCAYSKYQKIVE